MGVDGFKRRDNVVMGPRAADTYVKGGYAVAQGSELDVSMTIVGRRITIGKLNVTLHRGTVEYDADLHELHVTGEGLDLHLTDVELTYSLGAEKRTAWQGTDDTGTRLDVVASKKGCNCRN